MSGISPAVNMSYVPHISYTIGHVKFPAVNMWWTHGMLAAISTVRDMWNSPVVCPVMDM